MAKRSFAEVIEERLSVVTKVPELTENKKFNVHEALEHLRKKAIIMSPIAVGIMIMHPMQVLGIQVIYARFNDK